MYNVSQAYLTELMEPVHEFRLEGDIGGVPFDESNLLYNTLTIRNQCSSGDEMRLGSVYGAELNATFIGMSGYISNWRGRTITLSEGMYVDGDYEYVPLGVFIISECNHTLQGVEIVAYDAMSNFDRAYTGLTSTGTLYDWLVFICSECNVTLGMTEEEIAEMPNGSASLELSASNDINTYRDVLFWIAQTLGGIATINRSGQLEIRHYSDESVATISEYNRFNTCSFSDFRVFYTSFAISNTKDGSMVYLSEEVDNGLMYNLGANPFIQSNINLYGQTILDDFSQIELTPFKATMAGGALWDLCDCLHFTGGIAGNVYCGIMSYVYTFGHGYTIEGFGKNPELSGARGTNIRDLAVMVSSISQKALAIATYTNINPYSITGILTAIVQMRYGVTVSATDAMFMATINFELSGVEDTTDVVFRLRLNRAFDENFIPTKTLANGNHSIAITHPINNVSQLDVNQVDVYVYSSEGTISISTQNISACIIGAGLVGTVKWNGELELIDEVTTISIPTLAVKNILDTVRIALTAPTEINISDTSEIVTIPTLTVTPITDYIGTSPSDPTPIVPEIARAIVQFDISGNDYMEHNANNQIVLRSEYIFESTAETIDSGSLAKCEIETSDKASITSIEVS